MENLIDRTPADLGARSPDEEKMIGVALALLRARARGDTDAVARALDERIVYHEVPFSPAKGLAEARVRALAWREAIPDLEIVVERVVAQVPAVVILGRLRGTARAGLFGRAGNGNRLDLPFAQLALVRSGKIVYVRDHWDLATLIRETEGAGA